MNINDIPTTTTPTSTPITGPLDNPDEPTAPGFVPGPAKRNRRRLLVAAPVAIAAGALGVLLVGQATSAPTTSGAAQLEPRSAPGVAPFTAPVGADQTNPNAGGTPGTPVCDSRSLIGQLQADPVKAGAWASVFGIGASDIPRFVTGLTPVVLRADTAVTDHGYRDGSFTAYPAVLQAGTSAFVTGAGTPTVKCFSGDPLTGVTERPITYVGTAWPQFQPDTITIVTSTNVVNGGPGGLANNPSGGQAGTPGTGPAPNGGGAPGGGKPGTPGSPGGSPGGGSPGGGGSGGSPGGGSPGGGGPVGKPGGPDPFQQAYDAAKAAADAAHATLTQFGMTLNTDIDTAKAADKALAAADAALQKATAAENKAAAEVHLAERDASAAQAAYLNAKSAADNDSNPLTKIALTAQAAVLQQQFVQAETNWQLKQGAESVAWGAKNNAQADFDKKKATDQKDNSTVQTDWAMHYKQEGAAAQADRDLATAKANLDQHKKDNPGGQQAQSLNSVQSLGGLTGPGTKADPLTGSSAPGGSPGTSGTGTGSGPAGPGGSSGTGASSQGSSSQGGTSSGGSSQGGSLTGGKSTGNTTGSGTSGSTSGSTSGGTSNGVGKNMTRPKVDLSPVEK